MSWTRRLIIPIMGATPLSATDLVSASTTSAQTIAHSGAAAHALAHPLGCIGQFNVKPVPYEGAETVGFRLSCRGCGSSKLRIMCYPKSVAADDDYAGLSEGDILERDPHDVECAACGERHLVFDQGKHGYDGALGHGRSYELGTGESKPIICNADSYNVELLFTYNISLDELNEIAAEDGLSIQDLFDAVEIIALAEDGTVLKSLDYECA